MRESQTPVCRDMKMPTALLHLLRLCALALAALLPQLGLRRSRAGFCRCRQLRPRQTARAMGRRARRRSPAPVGSHPVRSTGPRRAEPRLPPGRRPAVPRRRGWRGTGGRARQTAPEQPPARPGQHRPGQPPAGGRQRRGAPGSRTAVAEKRPSRATHAPRIPPQRRVRRRRQGRAATGPGQPAAGRPSASGTPFRRAPARRIRRSAGAQPAWKTSSTPRSNPTRRCAPPPPPASARSSTGC